MPKQQPSRPLDTLLTMPANTPITPKEAASIVRKSEEALAQDRSRGVGIPYYRIGRSIRYRLGAVLGHPDQAVQAAA
jgi:hypothetical protein